MRKQLAIDAGGTTTRAVVLDDHGHALGYGRAGSGNPTASGIEAAAAAVVTAARRALRADPTPTDADSSALIALAGSESVRFRQRVAELVAGLGFDGEVQIESDLLGMFFSGTHRRSGYALIAGTGTVAARIDRSRLQRVAGGTGWLLGDAGSGFWIGHRVARAVSEALDGQGPQTRLTELVLPEFGIPVPGPGAGRINGRPAVLEKLIDAVYESAPVQLSRLAPLAFRAQADAVAHDILVGAANALAELLAAVHDPGGPGALVLGGSVLQAGLREAPHLFLPPLKAVDPGAALLPVPDGLLGAAVLAARRSGVTIDGTTFAAMRREIGQQAAVYDAQRH